jgi:hypothetical protein
MECANSSGSYVRLVRSFVKQAGAETDPGNSSGRAADFRTKAAENLRQLKAAFARADGLTRRLRTLHDAAAVGYIRIPLPAAPGDEPDYIGKSNAHRTAVELAGFLLRETWKATHPQGYEGATATPDPFSDFDPEATAERLVEASERLAAVLPVFKHRELFDACRNEYARATQLPGAAKLPGTHLRAADGEPVGPEPTHDDKFTSIYWHGRTYTFSKSQAPCVELLWKAWKQGIGVHRDRLVQAADCADPSAAKVADIFRGNDAWTDRIIRAASKGVYRLSPPEPRRKRKRR